MAKVAITAATVLAMSTPAVAHPSFEHFMDRHEAPIGLAPGAPVFKHAIWEIDERAREDWRRIDARYEARQRELKRQREAEQEALAVAAPPVSTSADWYAIAMCESSGDWSATAGMFEGGLQFLPSTWDAYAPAGYPEAAYLARPEQQIYVGELVLDAQGPSAWPTCFVGAS